MLAKLVQLGFDPAEALTVVGLPSIAHTGLPTVQLQQPATLNPEDPEEAYPVREALYDDWDVQHIIDEHQRTNQPVINVHVPEPQTRSRKIKRDDNGDIVEIVEE